ncbi:stage II sporulation protein E (SpoIIE) [Streptomyces griseoflavus Tu4000]|uniref:Stage II sporulation protein E (SpoIIE) n=1 Tax=Streptomyces griseoflavus Tu4000 TaxID=467200 RepID=D9XQT8_9ACTN|nr:stage II sporulation protein E (SpoIIE) [Streptomyces griseoflavus Tu4000]
MCPRSSGHASSPHSPSGCAGASARPAATARNSRSPSESPARTRRDGYRRPCGPSRRIRTRRRRRGGSPSPAPAPCRGAWTSRRTGPTPPPPRPSSPPTRGRPPSCGGWTRWRNCCGSTARNCTRPTRACWPCTPNWTPPPSSSGICSTPNGPPAVRRRRPAVLLTFLADASAVVTASLDHEDILRRVSELLVPHYAAEVDVWLFDEAGAARGGARSAAAVRAARTGRPQHAGHHPGGLPGTGDLPPSALSPDRSLLCIPLTVRRTLGVLTLTAPDGAFDADTGVMLVELARRVAIALEHALRYEQHRDTAETLQRAQLTDLPAANGLRLAARYLPATRGLNIGGDWYDAFVQPDGSLLAVIGDVTGHGLPAAVLMGQLRTALRAYAVGGAGPAEILTRLHRMLRHQQPHLYATAMIARFRPGEPRAVWASAGHPPAVVRAPGGAVRVLDGRPGVMLGVPVPFTYREHTAAVEAGSTLVLYTDGLVERRTRGIDAGIELLGRALAALDESALDDLELCAESLVGPLVPASERDDDVCLLLCRTTPSAVPPPLVRGRDGVPRPAGPLSPRAFGGRSAPR